MKYLIDVFKHNTKVAHTNELSVISILSNH